ncbi:hypothetical protein XENORESO_013225 [Xenotaenia resolanae]|uniref:Uncharacterized protein n=1 Tax=Xenotaenia resolanae TaxID=208358 RepID=A0ABV0X7M5_9TELE
MFRVPVLLERKHSPMQSLPPTCFFPQDCSVFSSIYLLVNVDQVPCPHRVKASPQHDAAIPVCNKRNSYFRVICSVLQPNPALNSTTQGAGDSVGRVCTMCRGCSP